MNAAHLCVACRRRLSSQSLRQRPTQQCLPRATFVSLAQQATTNEHGVKRPYPSSEGGKARLETRHTRSSAKKQNHAKVFGHEPGDVLEALFEEGLQTSSAPRKVLVTPRVTAADLKIYKHIETLDGMLADPHQPIEDSWLYFVANLGPRAWMSSYLPSRPSTFHATAKLLFDKLLIARQQEVVSPGIPTATEITETYAGLGRLVGRQWNAMLWTLLKKLSKKPARSEREKLVQDILGTWRVAFNLHATTTATMAACREERQEEWLCLPTLKSSEIKSAKHLGGVERIFQLLLPTYTFNKLRTMTSGAVATFALLLEDQLEEQASDLKGHPFVKAVAQLLSTANVHPDELEELLRSQSVTILDNAGIDLGIILKHAPMVEKALLGRALGETPRPTGTLIRRVGTIGTANIQRELARALAAKNLSAVDSLWARIGAPAHTVSTPTPVNGSQGISPEVTAVESDVLSQEVCDDFILTYMGLRQPGRAIDVWNHMVKNSLAPTLVTWNAMLEASRSSRSAPALEGVWAKLLDSGLKPDTACWTTRVSGLIECGKTNEAVRVLDEMGQTWLHAVQKYGKNGKLDRIGDVNGIVKPSIATINAAIAGFLRRGQSHAAYQILAWGSKLGVRPDIITFNTLLRALVREDKHDEVKALLQQMHTQGVRPDVATFTTLLEQTFRSSRDASPEEQIELVNGIFTDMAAAGIQANLRTYGTIIYSLLHTHTKDMTVVAAVMERMNAQGLEPSTYIYTILVEHYFAQDQPNLEAVRHLIERITASNSHLDHIFWDRVIGGYARGGDTSSALNVLRKIEKEGSKAGWYTMEVLLRALAENAEWDLAKDVVRNTRLERGNPPLSSEKGVEGQHSFWQTVADYQLLDI